MDEWIKARKQPVSGGEYKYMRQNVAHASMHHPLSRSTHSLEMKMRKHPQSSTSSEEEEEKIMALAVGDLIPEVPQDVALECLCRLHFSVYPVASRVSPQWRDLLQSQSLYQHRKKLGHSRHLACLVQAQGQGLQKPTPSSPPTYAITLFDPLTLSCHRLPSHPHGLPLFSQIAGCRGRLVLMGGWHPLTYEPLPHVFVYDFRTALWRRGNDMPSNASFFAIASSGDRVYVAGGHDASKNALQTASLYDVERDEWSEMPPMSQERDECEGRVVGDQFWVLSGYATEQQGMFDASADVYHFGSGRWSRVEGVWEAGRCPRSCLGMGKDGRFVSVGEEVRVGVCVVSMGPTTMVIGSQYQGGPPGFHMQEGHNGKLKPIVVPDQFSGFVHSGCSVDI